MDSFKHYKIVSIDGNIGSGKSTLLENLKKHYKDNKHVIFLKEPVDEWANVVDKNGVTMLQKFYDNQEKYSFPFQMMAYISRLKILKDTIKYINNQCTEMLFNKDIETESNRSDIPKYIIITERSLYTDKEVFAKMLHDQGKIEDVCYQIYLTWFNEFTHEFPVDYNIYVKTTPENCYDRIHKRSREGESSIPLSYLKVCHDYHKIFIAGMNTKKLELDGNVDIFKNEQIVEDWFRKIEELIF